MKLTLLFLMIFGCSIGEGAMTAAGCQTKVKAAYKARTGKDMADGGVTLIDLCKGLIEEIQANAVVSPGIPVTTPAGAGATSGPGVVQ